MNATSELLLRYEEESHHSLSDKSSFLSSVSQSSISDKQLIVMEGEKCPFLYVVRKGLFKQFYTKLDGTHWISCFSPEGCIVGCPRAFMYGKKSTLSCIAMEPSIIEKIHWPNLELRAKDSIAWCGFTRWLVQLQLVTKTERERELLMLNPEELYLKYQSDHPEILQRVPQKDIASFLGVTAVGLNRIIKRAIDKSSEFDSIGSFNKKRQQRVGWRSISIKAK